MEVRFARLLDTVSRPHSLSDQGARANIQGWKSSVNLVLNAVR